MPRLRCSVDGQQSGKLWDYVVVRTYCDKTELCAEAKQEGCTCPWSDWEFSSAARQEQRWRRTGGVAGARFAAKARLEVSRERRGLSAAWSRSKPRSQDRKKISGNQRQLCVACFNPETTKPIDLKSKIGEQDQLFSSLWQAGVVYFNPILWVLSPH